MPADLPPSLSPARRLPWPRDVPPRPAAWPDDAALRDASAAAYLPPVAAARPSDEAMAPVAAEAAAGDGAPPSAMAAVPVLPRLLSVQEVAVLFGRNTRTIRGWAQDGRLKAVRVGRSVFFKYSDVKLLIDGPFEINESGKSD
jgi:excisionase family DNA binding protein